MTRALLLLALALAGCAERPDGARTIDTYAFRSDVYGSEARIIAHMDSIAQADPTTEADWAGRVRTRWPDMHVGPLPDAYSSIADSIAGYPYPKDSLTVTNATAHTLILEQAHVVTLAKPGGTYTVELAGPVTITEASEYDD